MSSTPNSHDEAPTFDDFFENSDLLAESDHPTDGPPPAHQLKETHFDLIPPQELSNEQLPNYLNTLFEKLANLHIYLFNTDHLSDRQLYERLYQQELQQPVRRMGPNSFYHIDLIAGGSRDDLLTFLTYYADDEEREDYQDDWPDLDFPQSKSKPFRRDSSLPQPSIEFPEEF